LKYKICAISDVGCVRRNNEDMFLVNHHRGRDEEYRILQDPAGPLLVAVADGMGGHSSGEIASERTLALLDEHQLQGDLPVRPDDHAAFVPLLETIHHAIQDEAAVLPEAFNMGATLVGCVFYPEGNLVRFHAGDSRLYRLRDGVLERLTVDHTVREELSRAGGDPERVGGHLVTSCIGGGMARPRVDTGIVGGDVAPGDRFLLCSDGLTDMVDDGPITERLLGDDGPVAARSLIDAAREAGGSDNVTVVVIDVEA